VRESHRRQLLGDAERALETIAVVLVVDELESGLRHARELEGKRAQRRERVRGHDAYSTDVFLSGTLLNAATVLIGGLIGTRLGARLPDRLRATVVRGLGLFTIALGLQGALQTRNVIILLFAILLGGLAGSALRSEEHTSELQSRGHL